MNSYSSYTETNPRLPQILGFGVRYAVCRIVADLGVSSVSAQRNPLSVDGIGGGIGVA